MTVRRLFRLAERTFAVIGLLLVTYHAAFDLGEVLSPSMEPTLRGEGGSGSDWVLTEKLTGRLRRPRRWELLTFRTPDGLQVVKRVVGLPGETVALRDGGLWVDGRVVARPAALASLRYLPYGNLTPGRGPVPCGDGFYLLGDASQDSQDSRFEGPIPARQIVGRAWLVVWPLNRAGPAA